MVLLFGKIIYECVDANVEEIGRYHAHFLAYILYKNYCFS